MTQDLEFEAADDSGSRSRTSPLEELRTRARQRAVFSLNVGSQLSRALSAALSSVGNEISSGKPSEPLPAALWLATLRARADFLLDVQRIVSTELAREENHRPSPTGTTGAGG